MLRPIRILSQPKVMEEILMQLKEGGVIKDVAGADKRMVDFQMEYLKDFYYMLREIHARMDAKKEYVENVPKLVAVLNEVLVAGSTSIITSKSGVKVAPDGLSQL